MTDAIRSILKEHAQLAGAVEGLADDADLYAAGLTSHATVNVMLALEEAFDVEFPERMMRRRSFESISAIRAVIEELTGRGAA
jgi:acyl carrier protein